MNNYVLITPAKNEEKNIWRTIESVISQNVLPSAWVIVSDGSTDSTDELVKRYCKKHAFIKFLRNESPADKDFSSKVNAFNKGLAALKTRNYSFIGNLDADVSFEPEYFEKILEKMEKQPKLGIAGGLIYEVYDGKTKPMRTSLNSVAGAVQLFKKECFEQIGGYLPIRIGGIDSAAEICARAKGWYVHTFAEYKVLHHGRVLTGKTNLNQAMFQMGMSHYMLGYHPLFHFMSSISRLPQRPLVIGALYFLYGYLKGSFQNKEKALPEEVIKFLRNEQLCRLREILSWKKYRI